jgi:hypothetical protein
MKDKHDTKIKEKQWQSSTWTHKSCVMNTTVQVHVYHI